MEQGHRGSYGPTEYVDQVKTYLTEHVDDSSEAGQRQEG